MLRIEKTTDKSYGYEVLRNLPKDTTLYTVLRRVSRSRMTRIIDLKYINTNNQPRNIIVSELAGCAKDTEQESKWGGNYKVPGCGMDMGFWLVYELGQLVHQDGYYFKQEWL